MGGHAVLPRADDEIGAAVTVYVPAHPLGGAEPLPRRLALRCVQATAGPTRIHIDLAGARSFGGVGPVRGIDVRDPIAVHIAKHRDEHVPQGHARRIGIEHKGRTRGQVLVDVNPSSVLPPGARRTHHEKPMVAIGVSRHRAAEGIAGSRAGQGQEQSTIRARIDVSGIDAQCARHHIRNPVAVHIARGFNAHAELIAGRAVRAPQQRTRAARIYIQPAGILAADILARRASDEIIHAVTVDIADDARDPSELIARRRAMPEDRVLCPVAIYRRGETPWPCATTRTPARGDRLALRRRPNTGAA